MRTLDIALMAHNDDEGDWNDLRYRECWHEGYLKGGVAVDSLLNKQISSLEKENTELKAELNDLRESNKGVWAALESVPYKGSFGDGVNYLKSQLFKAETERGVMIEDYRKLKAQHQDWKEYADLLVEDGTKVIKELKSQLQAQFDAYADVQQKLVQYEQSIQLHIVAMLESFSECSRDDIELIEKNFTHSEAEMIDSARISMKTLIECIAGAISKHITTPVNQTELLAAAKYIAEHYGKEAGK